MIDRPPMEVERRGAALLERCRPKIDFLMTWTLIPTSHLEDAASRLISDRHYQERTWGS